MNTPLPIQNILILLCGIWSLGIGVRLTVELQQHNFLIISHPLFNILDWLILAILGLLTILISLTKLIKYQYPKLLT